MTGGGHTDDDFDVDWIVVGQGLAGTALAWRLIEEGQRVLVIDPDAPITSSRIAAGLMTPITGKTLARGWSDESDRAEAETFYHRIEGKTGKTFFSSRTALRLFVDAGERLRWQRRCDQPAFQLHLVYPQPTPLVDPTLAAAPESGFAMRSAQLNIASYLAVSAAHFERIVSALDWRRDVVLTEHAATVFGRRARGIVSCEGFEVTRNPFFGWLPFRAAKGDILTIRVERPLPPIVLHRGVWVAPTSAADVFKVGATFAWSDLDTTPSQAGRDDLVTKLDAFFRVPYEIIDHQAAVRPIIETSRLAIGRHPQVPRLAVLNGLAAKGTLRAPIAAATLVAHLVHGAPIPATDDVARFLTARPAP